MTEEHTPVEEFEPMNDEQTLEYTQRVRRNLVHSITVDGTQMPLENKDRLTLLSTLDGMDRAALAVKKIESKEKTSSADREAQMVIASMNSQLGDTNPLRRDPADGNASGAPTLDESKMEELTVNPGETEIGISQENAEAFLSRFEQERPSHKA